jgi:CBS domain containing-hemolysin-like protein
MTFIRILILSLLVLVNGFFVAAEFALVKVRMSQIEPLARKGKLRARAVGSILKRLDAYLSACQLGITLASLGLGWIGEPVVAALLHPVLAALSLPAEWVHYISLPFAFVVITFLHITIGEQAPKMLAIQKEQATSLAVSIPLVAFYFLLRPIIVSIIGASNLILRLLGLSVVSEHGNGITADELRLMVAETIRGGELSRVERVVMRGVLEFEDKIARQIMVPRPDIVFMDTRRSLKANLKSVLKSGHTRFPVCDGNIDRVVGMLHTRDLLKPLAAGKLDIPVEQITRRILFLPETVHLNILLLQFQRERTHLAMLLDEYGGVEGMVTLEDVLEELVGQIQDEFDHEEPVILPQESGRFIIEGKCPLDVLERRCGVEIPEVRADTAGGLMAELMGHIPGKGEEVRVGRHLMVVLDALPTRVSRIELREAKEAKPPGEASGESRDA